MGQRTLVSEEIKQSLRLSRPANEGLYVGRQPSQAEPGQWTAAQRD